jgi:hypothetical protein
MKINYTSSAFEALCDVVNFIESKNTLGAGSRWLLKFEVYLIDALQKPALIKLCHNLTFRELGLRCIHYNDWVIAFSITQDSVLIEAVLHHSRLVD